MDRVTLISGIPEIWVSGTQQRLSWCSLKFTAQARRGQEGDGDSITHRLKREDSVEKHQQTHTPGHAKVLKAQVTLFLLLETNAYVCTYMMTWPFGLYLLNTNWEPRKQQCPEVTRAGWV